MRLDAPPIVFERGHGAWLWDVDGNDYVDYLLGQGPAFLGHAPEPVLRAVEEASRKGLVYGAQNSYELPAAERLLSALRWPDMVRFGSTGTEMVQAALRVARAATGRRKFVRFEGHYHGWLDNVLIRPDPGPPRPASAGQVADHLGDAFVLPWNDLGELRALLERNAGEIAAVLMEPVMLNSGAIEAATGYLSGVADLCRRHGVVLIFDEVISGFRLALGGAAERFGVVPDLAVYGKAMGGGWPVAALAGSRELMEPIGTGEVTHAGTFNGNVMACAATIATLEYLMEDDLYEHVEKIGGQLMRELAALGADSSVPIHVQGFPAAFHVAFGDPSLSVRSHRDLGQFDHVRYRRFAQHLCEAGTWVAGRGIWYLSTAHGEMELEATIERAKAALRNSRRNALPERQGGVQ